MVATVASAIWGSIKWIWEGNLDGLKGVKFGLIQIGLGVMEFIPIIGTIGHIYLDEQVKHVEAQEDVKRYLSFGLQKTSEAHAI